MAGQLIGLMNNATNEIIAIEEFINSSMLSLKSEQITTDGILGTVYKIEQYHYSKDLNKRDYLILYKLGDKFFERFVNSDHFSPIFYRDMKPKYAVGDTIFKYSNVDKLYEVTKVTDLKYQLTNVKNNISITFPIDEVNVDYTKNFN